MKKIIFETTAQLIAIMILESTIKQATIITSPNLKTNKDITNRMPPQYFILLFGKCEKITLNNQTDAYGRLKGDLLIYNKHVFGTIENYWILALDKYNNEIHTKQSLPKKFTLIDFTGYGLMRWIPFPHSPCSQFLIMGNAQYMIEHE